METKCCSNFQFCSVFSSIQQHHQDLEGVDTLLVHVLNLVQVDRANHVGHVTNYVTYIRHMIRTNSY